MNADTNTTTDGDVGVEFTPTEYDPEDVEGVLSLAEWLDVTRREWAHDEYIRVIPDREGNELRLYATPEDATVSDSEAGFYRTHLPARVAFHTRRDATPRVLNLHAADAMTLVAFCRCLVADGLPDTEQDGYLSVSYWEDNGKGLTEGTALTEETLYVEYKRAGRSLHQVSINSVYSNDIQMMAGW